MVQLLRRQFSNIIKNCVANYHFSHRIVSSQLCLKHRTNLVSNVRHYAIPPPTYDGDGKTYAELINNEDPNVLMINAYSHLGFRLNNGSFVLGPMAIFPKALFSWDVESVEDINEESLSLVTHLHPKLDILVIGTGDAPVKPDFNKKIIDIMRKSGTNVEILPTQAACATFNFLCSENRLVAGLFIPPFVVKVNEDDLMKHKQRQMHEGRELDESTSTFKKIVE